MKLLSRFDDIENDGIDTESLTSYCFNHVKSDMEVHELNEDEAKHEFEDLRTAIHKRVDACVDSAFASFIDTYF